jgi:hypothetical protein
MLTGVFSRLVSFYYHVAAGIKRARGLFFIMSMIKDVIPAVLRAIALAKITDEQEYNFDDFKAACWGYPMFSLPVECIKIISATNEHELFANMDLHALKVLCKEKDVFDDQLPITFADALEQIEVIRKQVCLTTPNAPIVNDMQRVLEIVFTQFTTYGELTNKRDGTPVLGPEENMRLQDMFARVKFSM